MTALTLKWDIVGHETQLKKLEHDIVSDNVAHAYLFRGPRHIGKSTVAKQFASLLQGGEAKLDTFFYDEEKTSISIADIRIFQEVLSRKTTSQYRILVLPDIERLSHAAQNAFLKFLEEPPARTIFILTTSNSHLILSTILSRVRTITFQPPPVEEGAELAFLSQQRVGLAKQLAADPELLAQYQELLQAVKKCLSEKNTVHRFALVESFHEKPEGIEPFLNILRFYLRAHLRLLPDFTSFVEPLYISQDQSISLLEKIDEVAELLGKNVNKRLLLENFLLSF